VSLQAELAAERAKNARLEADNARLQAAATRPARLPARVMSVRYVSPGEIAIRNTVSIPHVVVSVGEGHRKDNREVNLTATDWQAILAESAQILAAIPS